MSDEHKISFLDGEGDKARDIPKAASEEPKRNLAEEQKSKKLSNKDDGLMTSKHISSARTGVISDFGGPGKFTKSESSNTIWESNKNETMAKDSKTIVKEQKEEIASNKRIAEQQRMNEMSENIKKTDQTKGNSVSPAGHLSGSNYYSPKNNMSIFDTQEFGRMAEQSSGEKLSEDVQKRRSQKDDSWKTDGKQKTTQDLLRGLFSSLTEKE